MRNSPVGIILLVILLLIGGGVAVYFVMQDDAPRPVPHAKAADVEPEKPGAKVKPLKDNAAADKPEPKVPLSSNVSKSPSIIFTSL